MPDLVVPVICRITVGGYKSLYTVVEKHDQRQDQERGDNQSEYDVFLPDALVPGIDPG